MCTELGLTRAVNPCSRGVHGRWCHSISGWKHAETRSFLLPLGLHPVGREERSLPVHSQAVSDVPPNRMWKPTPRVVASSLGPWGARRSCGWGPRMGLVP